MFKEQKTPKRATAEVGIQSAHNSGHTAQVLSSFYLESPFPMLNKPRNLTFFSIATCFIFYYGFFFTSSENKLAQNESAETTEEGFIRAAIGYVSNFPFRLSDSFKIA